jgi:hypothetical protein
MADPGVRIAPVRLAAEQNLFAVERQTQAGVQCRATLRHRPGDARRRGQGHRAVDGPRAMMLKPSRPASWRATALPAQRAIDGDGTVTGAK